MNRITVAVRSSTLHEESVERFRGSDSDQELAKIELLMSLVAGNSHLNLRSFRSLRRRSALRPVMQMPTKKPLKSLRRLQMPMPKWQR